jgi:hypothetical protein
MTADTSKEAVQRMVNRMWRFPIDGGVTRDALEMLHALRAELDRLIAALAKEQKAVVRGYRPPSQCDNVITKTIGSFTRGYACRLPYEHDGPCQWQEVDSTTITVKPMATGSDPICGVPHPPTVCGRDPGHEGGHIARDVAWKDQA